MNIAHVDGVISTKIGKSSHASISTKRDGKLFICEAAINLDPEGWRVGNKSIRLGNMKNPDVFTVVANPKSVSPYSGNIYLGKMPLTKVTSKN